MQKYMRTIWYVNVGRAGADKAKKIVETFKTDVEGQRGATTAFEHIIEQHLYVGVIDQPTHCITTVFDA